MLTGQVNAELCILDFLKIDTDIIRIHNGPCSVSSGVTSRYICESGHVISSLVSTRWFHSATLSLIMIHDIVVKGRELDTTVMAVL